MTVPFRAQRRERQGGRRRGQHRLRLDREILRDIQLAYECGDVRRARGLVEQLLDDYLDPIRQLLLRRLGARSSAADDREEAFALAMEKLVKLLAHKHDFNGTPFAAVVARNTSWAAEEVLRDRSRRSSREVLTDPVQLPALHVREAAAHEDLTGVGALLSILNTREKAIVCERALLDIEPSVVARRHGISRGALDTAYSRALTKLRAEQSQGSLR